MSSQRTDRPTWQRPLVAGLVCTAFIPIVAAVWFGMRVIRLGSWWGWLPIAVATAIGVYFLVLTGIAVVSRLLGGEGVI